MEPEQIFRLQRKGNAGGNSRGAGGHAALSSVREQLLWHDGGVVSGNPGQSAAWCGSFSGGAGDAEAQVQRMGSVRGKFFRGVEQTVGQSAEDNASDFSDSDDFRRSDLFHGLQRIFPIYLLLS